jgi:hypothetical protein
MIGYQLVCGRKLSNQTFLNEQQKNNFLLVTMTIQKLTIVMIQLHGRF